MERYTPTLILSVLLGGITSLSCANDGGHSVRFTQNLGQWDPAVLYKASVNGATVFMEQGGATWVRYEESAHELMHAAGDHGHDHPARTIHGHAWRMRFSQPAAGMSTSSMERLPGYENFFLGNESQRWRSRVPAFTGVRYNGVWPGIDVVYRTVGGDLKYDILVDPTADPGRIGMLYEGLDGVHLDERGVVVLKTSVGEVFEMAPVAFYTDGANEPVECRYQLKADVLGFVFGAGVDRTRPITIDPVLIASTLSGATGASNYGHCATYDAFGNIYTGARNFGPTYPATTGAFQVTMGGGGTDMSFSKYNPDGSQLLWASYLGGSSEENPHSMIVNANGELCIMGTTVSSDFPVSAGALDNSLGSGDIVVTHFSADGASLVGSTFVGGQAVDGTNDMFANYGETYRGEIFLDGANNIVVASCTSSSDFPVTAGCFQPTLAGAQDGVVFVLNPTCSTMLHATYIGGAQNDNALGIRIAVNGEFVVTGSTESSGFPVTAGSVNPTYLGGTRDGYVVRLSADLSGMSAGTFFGTDQEDRSYFIDTDLNDDIWIYGQTDGQIPITPASTFGVANGPIFIAKLTADLAALPVTTTIGGDPDWNGAPGSTVPVAFLVDVCGNIYISGYNSSSGLPTTPNALYVDDSFYLAAFEPEMASLLFGTYYGGSHVDGGTSRFDKNGVVYQGVCSGMGSLQTTAWAYAPNQTVAWDIGVFKIDFGVAGVNAAGASAINTGCAPIEVDFSNESTGDTWVWDFGDGSPTVEEFEPSHIYTEPGDYVVQLIAMDSLACNLADTTYFNITIGAQQTVEAGLVWEQVEDCTELRIHAVNTSTGNPLDHIWEISDGTVLTADSIEHVFDVEGTYDIMLIAVDPTGCTPSDTITTVVNVAPIEFQPVLQDRVLCPEWPFVTLDAGQYAGDYLWSTGQTTASIQVDELGAYTVEVTNDQGCYGTDTVEVLPPLQYELGILEHTCPGVPVDLTIPLDNATAYLWADGDTTRTFTAPGEDAQWAFVVVDAYGCSHADSAVVRTYDSDARMFVPNAFSPNADGINDTFTFAGYGEREVDVTIYDRWGERIYYFDGKGKPWDGTYDGGPAPNDVYVYVLKYTGMCTGTEQFSQVGHVTLVR
jgi:gliding motility-associated-like protein